MSEMLSILPDLSDSELSSDSSEANEPLSSDERKLKNECKEETAGSHREELSLLSVPPGLQGEPTCTSTLKECVHGATSTAAADAEATARSRLNSSKLLSGNIIKKFEELREKREKAAEEKVAEGYRRRRRRKRKFQGPSQHGSSTGTDQNSRTSAADDLSLDSSSEVPSRKQQEHWDTLKGYLDVNSHISQGVDHGHFAPNKSGLEKRLDEAVAEGDFDKAEELSEELSVRELGCKVAKAADARDYMKWKTERDEEKAAKKKKKKKKLQWGFEVKNRWEMKANM